MRSTLLILALLAVGCGLAAVPGAATPCPEGSMADVEVLISCGERHAQEALDSLPDPEERLEEIEN